MIYKTCGTGPARPYEAGNSKGKTTCAPCRTIEDPLIGPGNGSAHGGRDVGPAQKRHLSQSLQIRWVGGRQWAIRAPSGLHIRVRFSLSPTAVLVVAFHYARLQPAT